MAKVAKKVSSREACTKAEQHLRALCVEYNEAAQENDADACVGIAAEIKSASGVVKNLTEAVYFDRIIAKADALIAQKETDIPRPALIMRIAIETFDYDALTASVKVEAGSAVGVAKTAYKRYNLDICNLGGKVEIGGDKDWYIAVNSLWNLWDAKACKRYNSRSPEHAVIKYFGCGFPLHDTDNAEKNIDPVPETKGECDLAITRVIDAMVGHYPFKINYNGAYRNFFNDAVMTYAKKNTMHQMEIDDFLMVFCDMLNMMLLGERVKMQ